MESKSLFLTGVFSFSLILSLLLPFDGKARTSGKTSSSRVYKINIQGHDKIRENYVRNKLTLKVGQPYDLEKIKKDVKTLFQTGHYYDVIVDKEVLNRKIVITYYLKEKPFISNLEYKGNVKIKQEDLEKASEVKAYEILNRTKLNQAVKKIENLYEEKGYFLAEVNYEVKIEKQGKSVQVIFHITENDKVKVRRITFLGNRHFSSQKLKSVMFTKENGFFSFLKGEESYKQEAFNRDIQVLNFIYHNEGFIQVQILNPDVFVTPDKKSIYITFQIEEGKRFRVGNVDFSGDLLFPKKELKEVTKTKKGDYISYQKIQDDLKTLQAKYGDLGYAFANPIPRTFLKEKEKEVDLSFDIQKGDKVYINEIHIFGNDRTRDKVIRRELRLKEGELYHETRKRISEANVKRLGFFEEVIFLNKTSAQNPDQLDLEIRVKERSTGSLNVGASYASRIHFQLHGSLSQNNFLGYGNKVEFSTDFNRVQQTFRIKFLDRYFWDTNWEFGLDVYLDKFDKRQIYFNGIRERRGIQLRTGRPISDYLQMSLAYKLEKSVLVWDPIWKQSDVHLFSGGITQSVTGYLSYDRRDDRFIPSKGVYFLNSLEYSGLGSDLNFIRGSSHFHYFHPLIWKLVWRNNVSYSFLHFNDSREDKYYSEIFRLGGPNNLRGYYYNSLGPVQKEISYLVRGEEYTEKIIGGKKQWFYQTEIQALLVKESNMFAAIFYDVGGVSDKQIFESIYSNFGFGIRFFTPLGFIRFEFAFPLKKPPYSFDENYVFIFTMLPSF